MHRLGILSASDPLLRRSATRFTLPADAAEARRTVEVLLARAAQIRSVHTFSKGMGLAAPQIGSGRRVAVVCPPGAEPIVLINAEVVAASTELDQPRYEGCLSFFDFRGRVVRPLSLRIGHQDLDGTPRETLFHGSTARLVAHEIDHLDGRLYLDLMPPGEALIPIGEYRQSGLSWGY